MKQENRESKEDFRNNISKEEINLLEAGAYDGRITLVEDANQIPNCLEEIRNFSLLGFDTETRPSFRKNSRNKLALIQIASPDEVYLFRINKTGFHPGLKQLLEEESIKKVGVSIHDDIQRLRSLDPFDPSGFIELQELTDEYGIESNSLRKLAAIILGFRVSKSQQLSNWEAEKLSDAQMIYAATDAWVCLEIYNKLFMQN